MNPLHMTLENKRRKENLIYTVGFISSIYLSVATVVTFFVAILTLPLSGPYCAGACFQYPYTDIIVRFPRDYYWMYPAMLLMFIYVVYMVCIDQYSDTYRKIFSRTALSFA